MYFASYDNYYYCNYYYHSHTVGLWSRRLEGRGFNDWYYWSRYQRGGRRPEIAAIITPFKLHRVNPGPFPTNIALVSSNILLPALASVVSCCLMFFSSSASFSFYFAFFFKKKFYFVFILKTKKVDHLVLRL